MYMLAIGSDHGGYALKEEIKKYLDSKQIAYEDFGTLTGESCDYPDIANAACQAIVSGRCDRGILICGTGIGMAMAANKVKGIRAAVCHDPFSTERSRKSNDAQIMCMGARVIGPELAKMLVKLWLTCDFAGGGSAPKVERITEVEQSYFSKES